MSINLFVYGTLKDPLVFNKVTGTYSLNRDKAILDGYQYSLHNSV
ncbi:MAG: hypothetical protein ACOX5R_13720 [bacterium]|jgi:hypothetical protein